MYTYWDHCPLVYYYNKFMQRKKSHSKHYLMHYFHQNMASLKLQFHKCLDHCLHAAKRNFLRQVPIKHIQHFVSVGVEKCFYNNGPEHSN